MKFTNKDLLNALGLKVGDRIKLPSEDKPQIVLIGEKYIYDYEDSLRDDLTLAIIGDVKDLIDVEFTIIQPKPTLTEDEKVILRNLNKKWKWIARSEWESNLALYTVKPSRSVPSHDEIYMEREWKVDKGSEYTEIRQYNHLFQFIKWEDEPYSIEELLKE